jgi:hypothetical protein
MGKYQASELWDITLAGGSYRQGMATWNYLSLVITIRSSHRNELRMQRGRRDRPSCQVLTLAVFSFVATRRQR